MGAVGLFTITDKLSGSSDKLFTLTDRLFEPGDKVFGKADKFSATTGKLFTTTEQADAAPEPLFRTAYEPIQLVFKVIKVALPGLEVKNLLSLLFPCTMPKLIFIEVFLNIQLKALVFLQSFLPQVGLQGNSFAGDASGKYYIRSC